MSPGDPGAPVLGGVSALPSALAWAAASILWARLGRRVSAFGLNLGKGLIALAVLGLVFAWAGPPTLGARAWGLLGLSGLVGIAAGDTVYFAALVALGPRRMLVATTLVPVVAALLAMAFLGERPTWAWAGGTILCLSGVLAVLLERVPAADGAPTRPEGRALALAGATVLLEALGIFLSKLGLAGSGPHGALDATFVRLLFAVAGLALLGLVRRELGAWLAPLKAPRVLGGLTVASLVGTVLGIGLSMAALRLADVSLSAVLNATSPIFVLPLAAIFLGERPSLRAVAGAAVAVAGAALLLAS